MRIVPALRLSLPTGLSSAATDCHFCESGSWMYWVSPTATKLERQRHAALGHVDGGLHVAVGVHVAGDAGDLQAGARLGALAACAPRRRSGSP